MLLRHAHRESGALPGANISISSEGRHKAKDLGGKLARCSNFKVQAIVSSPLRRCLETAHQIASEVQVKTISTSRVLGDPGALITDDVSVGAQLVRDPLLFYSYFNGAAVAGMRPMGEACEMLLKELTHMDQELILAISHDWIIACVAKHLGLRFPHIIPDFLNGLWIPGTDDGRQEVPRLFQPEHLPFA